MELSTLKWRYGDQRRWFWILSMLPRLSTWMADMALGKMLEGMSTVKSKEHVGSSNGKANKISLLTMNNSNGFDLWAYYPLEDSFCSSGERSLAICFQYTVISAFSMFFAFHILIIPFQI